MDSSTVDEASVLARFDNLVGEGTVMYAEDMEKIYHEDGGFKFEFRITAALKSKPAAVGHNAELDNAKAGADGDPGSPTTATATATPDGQPPHGIEFDADGRIPGGDISIEGYEIGPVRDTHVLAFNKFCAYRPHLLLMTADGRRRQFEALDGADLAAAREVLVALDGHGGATARGRREYLVIYNCGKNGGCSRLHKHMQVIPAPEAIPMWPDTADSEGSAAAAAAAAGEGQEPPFRYLIHRFAGSSSGDEVGGMPSADDLATAYQRMLRQATELIPGRDAVVEDDEDGKEVAVPHNVILGRRWMVVVPRVTDGVDGAGVNAAGMLGVVWASEVGTVEKWKRLGPRRVLREVGVRN
ncbi:Diadenosine 5',5'''-P1,P4-tetraphosphate phosphorylase 2 [Colletotrichum tanaceti]|uniref:Diadenosine 5',5'''-P1,P4-tetraphosphate phosphorylase 2 n=1 Tax=Colletotrichum tanaceti TaxID=1306861 RepID=A0A4U6XLG3_9PEZI|nr:Diadenosine 5',5'''-P1,P4-tetraphosphate phosphorylase 2 [Colletotrichum tanaceti]TKW56477.1 Diadenosine 5',5'''-P1,P4-tetraphosphate phosphorylase 2 [Colletotrichum tanaceti]